MDTISILFLGLISLVVVHCWGCQSPVGRVYCKPETSVASCNLQFSTANIPSSQTYSLEFYNGARYGSVVNVSGQWYPDAAKDTNIILDNQQNIILTLLKVQVSNAGTYRISSTETNTVCNCLFVTGVPSVPSVSKDRDPSIGESATLICSSTSTTTPSNHSLSMRYDWSVSGLDNPVDTRYTYSTSRNTLTVNDARKEDSSKAFQCSATEDNSAGYSSGWSSKISFDIKYPPDDMPVIQQGTNFLMIENTTAELSCSVSGGNPLPDLTWNCYGTISDSSSGQRVTKVVTFTASRRQDRSCSCIMSHPSKNQTVNINVGILFPPSTPTFSIGPVNVSGTVRVIQSKTLTITCTSYGNPQPSLTWQYGGNTRSDTLVIQNIQSSDNGQYTCGAENIMSPSLGNNVTIKQSSSVSVLVLYGPKVSPIDKINIAEGQQLTKTCEFTPGNPSNTQFIWSRSKDQKTWTNQNLTFENISRSDASNYTCNATNIMEPTVEAAVTGVDSKTMLLNVWYSSSVTLFTLNDKRDSVTVAENDTSVVQCNVDSNPGSTITLRHNSQELLTLNNVKTLTYSLPQANCTDTGRYTCVGFNEYNVQHSTVDITFFVKCSPRPSPLVQLTKLVRSPLHASATLQFTALAYPVPDPSQFKWYRENNSQLIPIENNEATQITTEGLHSNLTIVYVTEPFFGNYTLKIQNVIGSWEQAFILEPYGVPNTPTGFKQLDEKATLSSVTLQWTPGFNGGPQQTFVLKYRKISTQEWTTVNITHHDETEMTHEIQQLSSGTQYEIVLRAANIIGPSIESLSINASTAVAASPPGINGAQIGGAVGGGAVCAIVLIVVVVAVIFIRRRRIKNGTDKSRLAVNTKRSQNTEDGDSDEDVMVENKMYESAGAVMTKDEPVYNKPTKKVKVESKNTDVYAVVDKTKKKDAQKVKKEKPKKKTQFAEGDVYENATEKSTSGNRYENAAFEDNLYENPEGSKPCKTPKKNVNADGLIYADLAFNDQPKGQKKLVIHGLDEMTTYVQVDFNRKADPLPDSDTEEQSENKKK